MHDVIGLTGYKSILCLNGELPDLAFFVRMNLPIIAADGAANGLLERGINPTLILGDLDSVYPTILQTHTHYHLANQDTSDYQKAMHYLNETNLLPAIVVGMQGGNLDHVLNNINIFMGTNCLLYSPPVRGLVIKKSLINLTLPEQTKISLLGIPKALISSTGLKWELECASLSFPGNASCFNRTHLPEISLTIHEGAVLFLIYDDTVKDAGLGEED